MLTKLQQNFKILQNWAMYIEIVENSQKNLKTIDNYERRIQKYCKIGTRWVETWVPRKEFWVFLGFKSSSGIQHIQKTRRLLKKDVWTVRN